MNPVPPPSSPARSERRAALAGLPLATAGAVLGGGAVALATGTAFGLAAWLGDGAVSAALAAACGVVVAGLPLAWFVARLARDIAPGRAGTTDAGSAPLAGMPRSLFLQLAEREFARARRYGTGAALLIVEIDRHVRLVEARGAAAGEALLLDLLRQTAPTLRTADVLTQFAGTQMAVFLAHADATGALDVAERIRDRAEQLELATAAPSASLGWRVSVSVGVAHLRPAHLSLAALIDDAQDALAAARQAGSNCVRAAPVDGSAGGLASGVWRERRARPKQGGPT